MPLATGTRLGPYEIVGPVGKGGMGEVFRARDTRLDRDVAIKVLPASLAGDEQFLARFQREAKTISALNHAHICALYDVGVTESGGGAVHYLVLEMLEGESLADRIARGPVPIEDVLRWGIEIASALDAAHSRGIVHRDIKPGNVMLTKSGTKLVDFGLAKSSAASVTSGMSTMQTMTAHDMPLTEQGTILGTFQYMAPEQLEGTDADARSDIFALGALLYEMATGRKAFEGKNRTSLIAAIVSAHPPAISSVQAMTPPALDHVVRRCLEKDPDDRWQSTRDVRAELQWIAEGGSRVGLPVVLSSRRRHREWLAWSAAAICAATAAGFAWAWMARAPEPAPVSRFSLPVPATFRNAGRPAISPDGRTIAFEAAAEGGRVQIWVRPLDALDARPIPGTEGTTRPFWSPDSRHIAFFADGKLRKVPLAGGPTQIICDAPTGSDGTWGSGGAILFDGRANDPIWRVEATGGVATIEVAGPIDGKGSAGWPEFLPDGQHYLYLAGLQAGQTTLMVRKLGEKEGKPLFATTSRVLYAPSGHIVFVREQTLVAQPFDIARLETTGEPVPIGEGLGVDAVGGASFSISQGGVLAFRPGSNADRQLLWVDRAGRETRALEETREYTDFWLSPDGTRLVFDQNAASGQDLWIRDFTRGVTSRFTFDAQPEFSPVWSPDGRRVAYASSAASGWDIYVKDVAGTKEPELLLKNPENEFPSDWTRDGSALIYSSEGKDTTWDLWMLPLTGNDRTPKPLVKTQFVDIGGSISPNGRYLAYQSNESGRNQIYVVEFPEAKNKWQISPDSGMDPFWRGDGRELYYRANSSILAVTVDTASPLFQAGKPETLFPSRFASVTSRARYRPAADGQRFLILAPAGNQQVPPATVVLNWTSSLR